MERNSGDAIKNFFEYCSKFSKLVIYGAGDVGKMVAQFMEKERIVFEGFCVSAKPEKHMLGNYEIREIDEICNCERNIGILVAVSKKNVQDILCLLDNRELPYFYSSEFLFELFRKKCEESASKVWIQDGYISRILDTAFERDTVYICCPASIGDTLYVAALVKAYKEENPSVRKVCLILKKGHGELGGLFPAVDEVLVSHELVEILDQYSMCTQTWRLKNYLYGHFKKSLRFAYDPEYNREDCRTIFARYAKLVLGLQEYAEPESIILDRGNLKGEGRNSVVLMPYAKTAEMLPASFWEELARRLAGKGYSLYTNVGSDKEKEIPGTKPLAEPLLNTALFCEGCRAAVSLRSGLCDLLGFTETKLIVLNTSEELFDEWNLNDVFPRDGIWNINCFEKKEYQRELRQIIKIIG